MRVSGFTIVRNALKLGYPFVESVRSIMPLCDQFIINCGDSDDNTRDLCAQLEREYRGKIRVLESKWTRNDQSGGFQLKHQTDQALAACEGRWCFYIQADEVIHEGDFPAIQHAMEKADARSDVDGLLFDWRHFYGSYRHEIRGRNWYRREVRLFKNGRSIAAFRDAQGFRKNGQRLVVLKSGAQVFHYGYVRTPASLQTKSQEMGQWWGQKGSASEVPLHRHVGLRRYEGSHPAVMQARLKQPNPFDPRECRRKWDWDEAKNALTLLWESVVPYRIGEFRNYEIVK